MPSPADPDALALLALGNNTAAAGAVAAATTAARDVAAKTQRGKSNTQTEDLLVCKAFVAASTDSILGTSQKGHQFKATMHTMYIALLKEQTEIEKSRLFSLSQKAAVQPDKEGSDNECEVYDLRNPNSVFDRFKRVISPRVAKFIGIEATTDMESGWNEENYYQACRAKFCDRYPKFGDCDIIRNCIEYLKTKPKWSIYNQAEMDKERSSNNRKQQRPVGNKKAKLEKVNNDQIKNIVDKLGIGVPPPVPNQDSSNVFYDKAGALLESVVKQMQAQQDRQDMELLDSPEKKAMKKQMFELRMAERALLLEELEAKRRKLLFDKSVPPIIGTIESSENSSEVTEL
jgi:hypothetical protein